MFGSLLTFYNTIRLTCGTIEPPGRVNSSNRQPLEKAYFPNWVSSLRYTLKAILHYMALDI